MKIVNLTSLILISLILFNCRENKEHEINDSKSITVYNLDQYYKTEFGKIKYDEIKVIDTSCINQEERAKKDIKASKLTYSIPFGNGNFNLSDTQLEKLLINYKISIDTLMVYCVDPPKGFKFQCYKNLMNLEIEKRFGTNFIDSLRAIADYQFLNENPKYIFSFFDCETSSRYTKSNDYSESLKMPNEDFNKSLKKDKKFKNEFKKEFANTELFFIIYKNGTIGQIKAETNYKDSKNVEFAKYFEKMAIEFVKKSKWKPGKYRGFEVNSEMHLNLYNN